MNHNEGFKRYHISNHNGIKIELSNLGAIIHRILIPANGSLFDVVLGFDHETEYIAYPSTYFGAIIGRNANRIAKSEVKIKADKYKIENNEGQNNLHSGSNGFHRRIWDVDLQEESKITFSLLSPHLDQGFPGELQLEVTYEITNNNELIINYKGTSDRLTVFNPTNHTYFNLNGHDAGTVMKHKLYMNSDEYSELDDTSIPTGIKLNVSNTPFDFRTLKPVSEDGTHEFDDNYILKDLELQTKAATLIGDTTGITMDVYTDMPCIQLYTGNGLDNIQGKDGAVYDKHSGVCLETQFEPNSVNSENPPFIDGVKEYRTIYAFSVV